MPAATPQPPIDHTHEMPAIATLERAGYTADFRAEGDMLRVSGTDRRYAAKDARIHDYYRFEGVSDPDDMSVIYAVETVDGTRGTLIDAYGYDHADTFPEEESMASRAETLATQFEAKVQEATTLIVADGKTGAGGSMDTIHAMNAKHAQEFAAVTKAETLALHKKNAAATAAIVRGGLLCSHIDEHLTSIRATVGR